MKKLYKKGKVHPSPPLISDHLSFLPATILTLTVALSPQDREVLAYLLSCSASSPTTNFSTSSKKNSNNKNFNGVGRCGSVVGSGGTEHPPLFYCNCFRCYTSYWVRWDASPNRQLIHDIIDAFEDELSHQNNKKNNNNNKNKKERKKKRFEDDDDDDSNQVKLSESVVVNSCVIGDDGSSGSGDDGEEEEDRDFEKGSVRKFVSFIGETIWGVWN